MDKYNCPRCKFSTSLKSNFVKHIDRVKECQVSTGLEVSLAEYRESLLIGSFEEVYTLKMEVRGLKEKLDALESECKQLRSNNEKLIKTKASALNGGPITAGRDVAMGDIINLNINLTAYNDPNLPDNVEKIFKESIKKIAKSVPALVEKLHFNRDIPENMNIKLSNPRSKTAKVFNGVSWKTVSDDALLDELVSANEERLERFAEENESNMRYINKYKEIKEREGQERFMKEMKEDVKRVLHDNNKMVKINI